MRWDALRVDAEPAAMTLPGLDDGTRVRTFDAPEALDTRFHEVRAGSVLNRVPNGSRMPFAWTVNPYRGCSHACVYCFARPTHVHLGMNPGRDFEREIVVKVNAPERLRADLARGGKGAPAPGEAVALGTNTDPYQWVESRYRLMPGIWEALRDARVPSSVLTKSPLLLRDLALMLELRDAAGFEAALSVPSLDERAWRATEPHTPHPRKRLEAVAELNRAGIPTGVLAAPLMPGINDAPEQVDALLAACTAAGATSVGGIGLHLRGETRDVFLEWLGDARPELVPLYAELYAGGAYLPAGEAQRLRRLITAGERAAPSAPRRAAKAGTSADRRWPAPQPAAGAAAPPLAPRPPRSPGTTRFDEQGRRRVAAARKAAAAEAATARAAEERQQRLF